MRKDVLRKLIDDAKKKWVFKHIDRTNALEDFLQTEQMQLLSEHDDVSFHDFDQYIYANHPKLLDPATEAIRRSKHNVANPFSVFLNIQIKERATTSIELTLFHRQATIHQKPTLTCMPAELWELIASYLDVTTAGKLSITSRFFYKHTCSLMVWKDRLIRLGCRETLLERAKGIQNYRDLYYTLLEKHKMEANIMSAVSFIREPWELALLSGDPSAIKYAIEYQGLTCQSKTVCGNSPLQLAVMSGKRSAVEYVHNRLKLDPQVKDKFGLNATDYAYIYSNSVCRNLNYYDDIRGLLKIEATIILRQQAAEQVYKRNTGTIWL